MIIPPMKALTVWQPWASLLACGAKIYETRRWATNYRGPIAIHAAALSTNSPAIRYAINLEIQNAMERAFGMNITDNRNDWRFEGLHRGCIIATAELVGCYEIVADTYCKSRIMSHPDYNFGYAEISEYDDEFLFGDWTPGRYVWEFVNMKMLDEPIPAKGRQGLWNWEGVA